MIFRYIIYLVLLLIILLTGIVRYKKLTIPFKILTILIGITFICEGIKKVVGMIFRNSMPVEHLTATLEFISFSLIYYFLLNSAITKKMILYFIGAFFSIWIINLIFFEKITEFPSITLNFSQFIYIIYSLLLFKKMLLSQSEEGLLHQSIFWFNVDMLFFSSSIFLIFGLTNLFRKHDYDITILYTLEYISNLVFYVLIGISIIIDTKETKVNNPI